MLTSWNFSRRKKRHFSYNSTVFEMMVERFLDKGLSLT
jgi:hypothetical protein